MATVVAALSCGVCLSLPGCGDSTTENPQSATRTPQPAPEVVLTGEEKKVWAPLPPDRSTIPVLLYHGIGSESDYPDAEDASYSIEFDDFAKQMTMIEHAGYQTINLPTFLRFVRGDAVELPPRPLLLTFDDARLDSWTGSDSILQKLGFNAVLFVDVGRVDEGIPEYLTWQELQTMQASGRWEFQLHSGHGHQYIPYGPGPNDYGPYYAYEKSSENFDRWQRRVRSDIEWGQEKLADEIPAYRPLAFAPPYGSYGQDGTNEPRIPDDLLGWLTERYAAVFTQDRNALAHKGSEQPLGRIQVTRALTGGDLRAKLAWETPRSSSPAAVRSHALESPRDGCASNADFVEPTAPLGALVCVAVMLTSACSENGDSVEAARSRVADAEEAVADAADALEEAGAAFCDEAKDYIAAIDQYGKAFDDEAATVGDLETRGADLGRPRDSTVDAGQAVLDAHEAVNEANQELTEARAALVEAKASASGESGNEGNPSPAPPLSEPNVPTASVDHVKAAEEDLEAASEGITDQTPLTEATETFTSAAFALEVAWVNLFADAGCLADEAASEAAAAVRGYTVALQTDLKTAGYLQGEVDGVYGPETVAAVEDLQADADLPVTGLVDLATRAALDDALARTGESAATGELVAASSVQTALKLAGYWPGAIDGEWTPELEAALREFQKDLGVEATGAVDAATLAALEELLVTLRTPPTAEPTTSSTP